MQVHLLLVIFVLFGIFRAEKRACDWKVAGSIPRTSRIYLTGESEKAALVPSSLPPVRCPSVSEEGTIV